MLGHTYSPVRQRRSFKKYYYALFAIFVIVLYRSGTFSSDRYESAEEDAQQISPRGSEKDDTNPYSHGNADGYGHHIHLPPKALDDIDESFALASPHASPVPEIPAVQPKDTPRMRGGRKAEESGDEHDVDGIDTISNPSAEKMEDTVKLTHPDDGAETDADHTDIGARQQVRLGQSETVDELLKADHPSKDVPAEATDVDTDVDEPTDLSDEAMQFPIHTLSEMTPFSDSYQFPSWDECQTVKDKADELPDMIHMPFEQAVADVVLEGWEDEWISKAKYTGPKLEEPKIDFVYNWVNGSQPELQAAMRPYELNSSLNDEEGLWVASHGTNRYREWDELRYSMRSVEKYAGSFTNRIQILVNSYQNSAESDSPGKTDKQRPHWLKPGLDKVQVLSQEEFFGPDERKCLPTFDSLTIENQLYNTKSETDRMFALSDDMILGKPHSASDLYSPLFGPTLGFKDNAYNTLKPPTEEDAERFGEKPFLIYTSWLLNRRFGARKRKGQVHFGHSLSRSIAKEAITSFPRPALRSAFQRFRGETGFQIYSWYVMFHYTMERHREALLWSYIMLRSDQNDDGYISWGERKKMLRELAEGMGNETPEQFRRRIYFRVGDHLEEAGLQPPKVNTDTLWTSLDGPAMIKDLDCDAFDTEDCLAPGFSMPSSDAAARSPVFSSAAIFDKVARESPRCGDCLLKLILNRRRSGLGALLPHPVKKPEQRATVVKALMKYQYTIVNPDANFYMVTDAEQAEHALLKPYLKHGRKAGQICLNDDVVTQDEKELDQLRKVMSALFEGLLPQPSSFET